MLSGVARAAIVKKYILSQSHLSFDASFTACCHLLVMAPAEFLNRFAKPDIAVSNNHE
jgi:hypothetical protein